MALFIPALIFLEVKLVGRLFVSEIFLIILLPFLWMNNRSSLSLPLLRFLAILFTAWLLAQIFTDVYRATAFEDWTRGWSKIIFLSINFLSIYLLLNNRRNRFILFGLGIALGQALAFYFNPNIYAQDYPWKFGYGMCITLLTLIFIQLYVVEKYKFLAFTMIAFLSILNFYMGFRSLGAICMLVLAMTFLVEKQYFASKTMHLKKIIFLFLLGLILSFGIVKLYAYAAGEGWLGLQAQELYLQQESGEFGFLLGGRTEFLASSQAVLDSPIIGYGSWAKDRQYADIMIDALREYGYYATSIEGESDLIPTHSYLMGAWVEAGIMGALFWFWVLGLVFYGLISLFVKQSNLTILISFASFTLLWDIPFSPLGGEGRLYSAFYFTLIIYSLAQSKNRYNP